MHRKPVLQAGLILTLITMLMIGGVVASPFPGLFDLFGGSVVLLLAAAATGIVGFALMIASTFLPEGKSDKPTFTQEMMGRERMNYGGVYTEGNWRQVLDDKEKEEKKRRSQSPA
jgi:hypothetical protein